MLLVFRSIFNVPVIDFNRCYSSKFPFLEISGLGPGILQESAFFERYDILSSVTIVVFTVFPSIISYMYIYIYIRIYVIKHDPSNRW